MACEAAAANMGAEAPRPRNEADGGGVCVGVVAAVAAEFLRDKVKKRSRESRRCGVGVRGLSSAPPAATSAAGSLRRAIGRRR